MSDVLDKDFQAATEVNYRRGRIHRLIDLELAVQTYFSWLYEARVDGTDCEREIAYWESEMERLSNG